MRATMTVLAQLKSSVTPLMPPVHVTPRRRVRSSTRVARASASIGAIAAASYAIGEDLLKSVGVALPHLLPLKLILHASPRGVAEALPKSGIVEQETNGRCERANVIGIDENPVFPVIDDLENAVDVRSDHGFAAGHRFHDGDPETLESRWQHEECALMQKSCDGMARLLPDETHLFLYAQVRDEAFELRPERPFTGDDAFDGFTFVAQHRNSADQNIQTFPFVERAHRKNE